LRLAAALSLLLLSTPGAAQQVTGAEQVRFASIFGWWMPAAQKSPAVIALHGCGGLYGRRGDLNERHRAMADLLGQRGFHVLFVDSFTPRGFKELCTTRIAERSLRAADRRFDVQAAIDWLAARPEVDARRIVLLGWSHGGAAVLASLDRGIKLRAAVAFYPGCSAYAKRNAPYQPSAPLLILIGALDDWTPAAACIAFKERAGNALQLKVLPDAHHDFDHPSAPLRVRKDVPGGQRPGEGVTVGSNPAARRAAYEAMLDFLANELR
jgi:dienelactone hydrolase